MPGLAFLMTENDQHNIHHCYETPAVEVLLQSSWSIDKKIKRLRRIQRRRLRPPDPRKTGTTRKEKYLIDKLRSELTEYCMLCQTIGWSRGSIDLSDTSQMTSLSSFTPLWDTISQTREVLEK